MNKIYNKGIILIGIVVFILVVIFGAKLFRKDMEIYTANLDNGNFENDKESETIEIESDEDEIESNEVVNTVIIDIDGAVNNPGVYEFPEGARVSDAITIAGGLTDNADTSSINRARKLIDEDKIYIPEIGEEITIETVNTINNEKININTASKEQLMSLKGIGPAYSQNIIDYRKINKFDNIEEIKQVSGIGEKTFEKIKDYITVN